MKKFINRLMEKEKDTMPNIILTFSIIMFMFFAYMFFLKNDIIFLLSSSFFAIKMFENFEKMNLFGTILYILNGITGTIYIFFNIFKPFFISIVISAIIMSFSMVQVLFKKTEELKWK